MLGRDGREGEDGERAGEERTKRVVFLLRADGAVGMAGEGVL